MQNRTHKKSEAAASQKSRHGAYFVAVGKVFQSFGVPDAYRSKRDAETLLLLGVNALFSFVCLRTHAKNRTVPKSVFSSQYFRALRVGSTGTEPP